MTFTRFSISFLLFSCNVTLIQADPSELKLGVNPVGSFYNLPEGSAWNGVFHFQKTHLFIEARKHKPLCKQNRDNTTCIEEVGRYILVEDGRRDFPSNCWFKDCKIDVKIPKEKGLLVDMYNVTNAPLLNFDLPPFYPNKECLGSEPRMLAPGNKRYNLRLYNIYLLITLKQTTSSNSNKVDVKYRTVKAQGILDNKRCNSFVTHKYISSRRKRSI
ncbi:hypothetical protein DSO57_1026363 [Entomophthora muscae]|uniref:Uncharacterized protein n=1 Tax=Entomophthora muscae TaxID=34485 RepID=A0ACC2SF44_9FUNG|nr:hypothetical protein DSO57_1026363 [Entomophthora muscae]